MDKEYLEDYKRKELAEYERLVVKGIEKGSFSFGKERYPPNNRFVKLQEPVALTTLETAHYDNIWAQIPFCGSLVLPLAPWPETDYARFLFDIAESSKIIDFVKETGKIQFVLICDPLNYAGLDFLDIFFEELKPPWYLTTPLSLYGNQIEMNSALDSFNTLARIKYLKWLAQFQRIRPHLFSELLVDCQGVYATLKMAHYSIVEDIENHLIDNPPKAFLLLGACKLFITDPINDLLHATTNLAFEDLLDMKHLPLVYQPQEVSFPCEIGKFLTKKLTYAAQGMRACYELMDHYDAYDLRRVQQSLHQAIVTNHPDIVIKTTEEFSRILDNIWNDKTIPNRIKNIEIGVPVSIAAIGGIAVGLQGLFAGGFLSDLGFKVVEKALEKFFLVKGEKLSERLAKLRTQSHQANIYDFKRKYNK